MIEQLTVFVMMLLSTLLLPPMCAICMLPGIVVCFFLMSMLDSFSLLGFFLVMSASASIPLAWFFIGVLLERLLTAYPHDGVRSSAWLPCVILAMASPELLAGETMSGLVNIYLWQEPDVFLSLFLYLSSLVVKWGVLVGCAYSLVICVFGILSHLAGVSLVARTEYLSEKSLSIYSVLLIPLSLLLLAISCQYVSQQFLGDLLQPLNQR